MIIYVGNQPTPASILALRVRGNSDFSDSSPNGIVPTTSGTAPTIDNSVYVFGGGSMHFGASAGNKIYSHPDIVFVGEYTLDFRMRIEGHNGFGTYMMGRTGSTQHYFTFNSSGSAASFAIAGSSIPLTGVTFATDTWYAIRLTHTGTNAYAFVDGVLKGSNASVGDETSAGVGYQTLRLAEGGNNDGFNGTSFKGWLDEVMFWKSCLSTTDYTVATSENTD